MFCFSPHRFGVQTSVCPIQFFTSQVWSSNFSLPYKFFTSFLFFLLFFYASFSILFIMNPVQLVRLGQFVQYFRLVFDCACLLLIALLMRNTLRAAKIAHGLA